MAGVSSSKLSEKELQNSAQVETFMAKLAAVKFIIRKSFTATL